MSATPAADASPPPAPPRTRATDLAVLLAALAFALLVAKVGIVRHLRLEPQTYDMGATAHFLAHPLHSGLVESIRGAPFVYAHVDPILVPLHPLTWLLDAAVVLLLTQALAMSATAWVLYEEARARTGDATAAALLGVGLLLDPFVHLALTFDAQPEAIAPLFLLLAVRAYRLERPRAWALALAAAALTKENLALVVLALASLPLLDRRGARWWGTALAIGAVNVLLLALRRRLVPYDGEYDTVGVFYGHLGKTLPEVAWVLVSRPLDTLRLLLDRPQPWPLLLPVLAAPLLRPRWLLPGLPLLLLHGLAAPWHHPRWWEFHGGIVLTVFAHLALVDVAASLRTPRRQRGLAAAALCVGGCMWLSDTGARELRAFLGERYDSTSARRRALVDRAPRAGRVVASTPALAALADVPSLRMSTDWISGRQDQNGPASWPAVDTSEPVDAFVLSLDDDGALLRTWPAGRARLLERASRMVVLDQVEGWLLLAREGQGPPPVTRVTRPAWTAGSAALLLQAAPPAAVAERGQELRLDLAWRRGAAPVAEVDLEATLVDGAGRSARVARRPLAWGLFSPAAAPGAEAAEALAETFTMWLPSELAPGPHTLSLRAVTPAGQPVVDVGRWQVELR